MQQQHSCTGAAKKRHYTFPHKQCPALDNGRPTLPMPPPTQPSQGAGQQGSCFANLSGCPAMRRSPAWAATALAAMQAPWSTLPMGGTSAFHGQEMTGAPLAWAVGRSTLNPATRVLTYVDLMRWPGGGDNESMPSSFDWDCVAGSAWEPVSQQLSCGVILHRNYHHCTA